MKTVLNCVFAVCLVSGILISTAAAANKTREFIISTTNQAVQTFIPSEYRKSIRLFNSSFAVNFLFKKLPDGKFNFEIGYTQ